MGPWIKMLTEWIEPEVISEPGTYIMQPSTTAPDYYRIDYNFPDGEYLLLEYRKPVGWDAGFYTPGMIIWHVDENQASNQGTAGFPGQDGWPGNGKHYKVAVLQAGKLWINLWF
jgi:hypothetical protein